PDFIAVFKAGLGLPVTDDEFQAAYGYYKRQAQNDYSGPNRYAFNSSGDPIPGPGAPTGLPGDHDTDLVNHAPHLTVLDAPADNAAAPNVTTGPGFGTVTADGTGGSLATKTVYLFNTGGEPLSISRVSLVTGNAGFSVSGFNAPVTLAAFDPDNMDQTASRLP